MSEIAKSEKIIDKIKIKSYLFIFIYFFFYRVESMIYVFFFFQAEDGIRDATVTGVQTCALPIWGVAGPAGRRRGRTGRPRHRERGRRTVTGPSLPRVQPAGQRRPSRRPGTRPIRRRP